MVADRLTRFVLQACVSALALCAAATCCRAAETLVDSGGTQHDFIFMADARSAARHGHYSEALPR
jgi:hypothetical protein